VARFGAVDGIIHVAALDTHFGGITGADLAEWRQVYEVNVFGSMNVVQAALPHLGVRGGSIVFIGTQSTDLPQVPQLAYASSKSALRTLTMSLACAYAVDGIRVNAVAPGWVLTNLSRGAREDPARNAMILSRVPVGRWADPAEIADPILFLCSDAARYVTGTVMPVDGGYTSVG